MSDYCYANVGLYIPHGSPTVQFAFATHIHCVSKNIPDVFSYNSRKHCRIFIIFGRNITKKASNQKMLYFPTSPN